MFIVACGAVIVKDGCVLVVQEKSGGRAGLYGIPGGRADFGETIPQCVERELYEETHIRAKFDYILYFRETDKTVYNASDLYFVCMMKYQPEALEQLKLC
jgi:ADP-ribose pyrophosphatase YjhB (NUDIX family)